MPEELYERLDPDSDYPFVMLEETVGKTVAHTQRYYVEGSYGDDVMVVLKFTDGTWYGIVRAD
jgi:hypothetical protein